MPRCQRGGTGSLPVGRTRASVVQRQDHGPPTQICRFESGHSLQVAMVLTAARFLGMEQVAVRSRVAAPTPPWCQCSMRGP